MVSEDCNTSSPMCISLFPDHTIILTFEFEHRKAENVFFLEYL